MIKRAKQLFIGYAVTYRGKEIFIYTVMSFDHLIILSKFMNYMSNFEAITMKMRQEQTKNYLKTVSPNVALI